MCDFWETVLFRAALYKGSAMTVHRQLHAKYPLRSEHFVRWLTLWSQTVDAMYHGPRADKCRRAGRPYRMGDEQARHRRRRRGSHGACPRNSRTLTADETRT